MCGTLVGVQPEPERPGLSLPHRRRVAQADPSGGGSLQADPCQEEGPNKQTPVRRRVPKGKAVRRRVPAGRQACQEEGPRRQAPVRRRVPTGRPVRRRVPAGMHIRRRVPRRHTGAP